MVLNSQFIKNPIWRLLKRFVTCQAIISAKKKKKKGGGGGVVEGQVERGPAKFKK